MTVAIDQKVRKRFSNAAQRYERLTDLHRDIGARLIDRIGPVRKARSVLDVGMGTGWFTDQLTAAFPEAMIIGLDFAPGMIMHARKRKEAFQIIQADAAHLPFKEEVFDIIASNLAYQWVDDLPKAFSLCREHLREKGRLYFTMFGHNTFHELFEALHACSDGNNFHIKRLVDEGHVRKALKTAGFRTVLIKKEDRKIYFPNMLHLIKWIKDIGANALSTNMYLGKELILKTNEYYKEHFSGTFGVYATFEVIWAEAER